MNGAPMFAHAVGLAAPCKACAVAGRRLTASGRPPILDLLRTAGGTWTACPVCDQHPSDAPLWRNT